MIFNLNSYYNFFSSLIFSANLVGVTILLIVTVVFLSIVVLLWLQVREVKKGCTLDTYNVTRQTNINPINQGLENNNSADYQQSIDDEAESESHYYDEINYDERRSKLS